MLTPPISMAPASNGGDRRRAEKTLVFPAPVLPISPIFSPDRTEKLTPFRTRGSRGS